LPQPAGLVSGITGSAGQREADPHQRPADAVLDRAIPPPTQLPEQGIPRRNAAQVALAIAGDLLHHGRMHGLHLVIRQLPLAGNDMAGYRQPIAMNAMGRRLPWASPESAHPGGIFGRRHAARKWHSESAAGCRAAIASPTRMAATGHFGAPRLERNTPPARALSGDAHTRARAYVSLKKPVQAMSPRPR